jgi:hypothetical protein
MGSDIHHQLCDVSGLSSDAVMSVFSVADYIFVAFLNNRLYHQVNF